MAKYKKKRARELQHDRFRDTTMGLLDRLGNLLEGRGKQILYGLGGLIVLFLIVIVAMRWSARKNDEARQALGRGIEIVNGSIGSTTATNTPGKTYASEQERATAAIAEFEKVAAKYGDPYQSEARYFIGTSRLALDRDKAMAELDELGKKGTPEIAALAKFALAQAKESDGKLDDAAKYYSEVALIKAPTVTPDSANLRLAKVYEKQGKKKEAADLLFNIVDSARKAKGADDKPIPSSSAAREAATELERLDAERYKQLPPEPPLLGMSNDLEFIDSSKSQGFRSA